MRLSTRGRYAVMALVELAARSRGQQAKDGRDAHNAELVTVSCAPVSLSEIAQAQQLSIAYLEQLFARLRRAGLVASARGPGGGYRLAMPAEMISVGAVIEAVDEPITATRCDAADAGCLAGQRCLTHDLWHELGSQIALFLTHVTLADVVDGQVLGRARPPRSAR
ncbi:Rrf2 family transcriptional regulator [Teichococcus oryzae]|uniref:Rrf2 family transcriptional regulator n=1 Tax=Teichococcus oryzae TaxID=1608942 RepID=A0A5B2TKY6_9PROT|nr:Rrf2 family transcriptional regulator [Pseudoroseomonas oryzae]KAA2215132.1 Rrf2 family transcriptional regulator [Pseudoroseomonas oryzae]